MRALAVIVVFLGSLSAALAQTGVVKSEGQPLPGATVRATQGERVLSTLTDANGEFKLANLTPGMWTIDVAMFGFAPQRREVQIAANPTKIDFTLQIGNFAAGRGGFGSGRFGGGGGGAGRGGGAPGGFNRGANPANAPNAAPDAGPGATVQADAAQGTLPDGTAPPADVAALQQANAGGANESFLVNGSLSNGLQTQASDFTPGQGPNGFGSGVTSAAQASAPGQGGSGRWPDPADSRVEEAEEDSAVVVSEDVVAEAVALAGGVVDADQAQRDAAASSAIAATPARTRFTDRFSIR